MAGFSELIKNFEKTRDYVRDFFLYGFKVRSDFSRKSARTYDDERRRVESWLGDYLHYEDSARGRQAAITVDSGHITENPLYQAYYARSFTHNDIRLHFLLPDLLADGKARSLHEITDTLSTEYGCVFDEQTVRGKLKEYVEEGILASEKHGNTMFYLYCGEDIRDLIAEYDGLADALRFFSEDDECGVIGNSMLHSADIRNNFFYHKHNFIVHTLEDETLLGLAEAVNEGKRVIILAKRAKNRSAAAENETGTEHEVVPLRILVSVQTGRRYLAAYIPAQNRFHTFRLDSLRLLRMGSKEPNYNHIAMRLSLCMHKCFGVSFGSRKTNGTVQPVSLTIHADPKSEAYIIQRLKREKRIGQLEQIEPDLWKITIDAYDPHEVMQWAKSFIGRIVSVTGGTEQIRAMFYADIDRMHKMYGGAENDVVS